jgi:hypothetical protein
MAEKHMQGLIVDFGGVLTTSRGSFDDTVIDPIEEFAGARRKCATRQEDHAMRLLWCSLHQIRVEIHTCHFGHHEIAQNDVEPFAARDENQRVSSAANLSASVATSSRLRWDQSVQAHVAATNASATLASIFCVNARDCRVILVGTVAEVQARTVHACRNQRLDLLRGARGGSKRADDFGPSHRA